MARFELQDADFGTALGTVVSLGETLFAMGLRLAGNPAEIVSAHMYFNLADRMGVEGAAFHRQDLAGAMTRVQIARAQRAAREWLARN